MAEEEPLVCVDGGASQDTSQSVPSECSVFFKGTISEAIAAAQAGWKILLVYVAGENEDSIKMSKVTWQDPKVIKQVSEWCISLHLLEGSKDAMNFSALYPVSGTPNLTLLGHNGLLLKKHEGYISPEDLLDMLQQYILKLQYAAANAVIAALSSSARSLPVNNASESSSSSNNETGSCNAASPQIHSSSDMLTFQVPPSHGTPSPSPESEHEEQIAGYSAAAVSSNVDGLIEQNCHVDTVLHGRQEDLKDTLAEFEASTPLTSYLGIENIQNITDGTTNAMHNLNVVDRQKTSEDDKPVKNKTYPILLQIRLTNGNCIRGQFTVNDSLEVVKSFVDMNRTDGTCSYSLAVPYPRKVFSDQDMMLTLLELDIKTRATLMLIPKQSLPSSFNDAAFTCNREETPIRTTPTGSMFWQLISFLNPFSFWGRTKSTTTSDSAGQYGQSMALNTDLRNSSPQRDIRDGTSYRQLGSFSRDGATSSISGQIQHNNMGSNIHTLQHDEDDIFRKGNAFWNGNSTQFGSDNSKPSN